MTEAETQHDIVAHYLSLPYQVTLTRESEDGEEYWFAEIPDLPGCMSDGTTPDEAIRNVEDAKQLWIEGRLEDGFNVPEPTRVDDYSGKFLLRMPKSLHRRLAEQARREGVSLNQHVNVLLSGAESMRQRIGVHEQLENVYLRNLVTQNEIIKRLSEQLPERLVGLLIRPEAHADYSDIVRGFRSAPDQTRSPFNKIGDGPLLGLASESPPINPGVLADMLGKGVSLSDLIILGSSEEGSSE